MTRTHSSRAGAVPRTTRRTSTATHSLTTGSTVPSSAASHTQTDKDEKEENNASPKLPVPLAVVRQALFASSIVSSWSPAPLRVEVETTQGYVYTGRMVDMDMFYNVTLTEALVRRERACDVLQTLLQHRHDALLASLGPEMNGSGGSGLRSGVSPASTAPAALRQRFVGTVMLRSSSIVMVRFLTDPSRDGRHESMTRVETAGGGGGVRVSDGAHDARGELEGAFGAMAAAVKKSLLQTRRKNREDRRRRIAAQEAKKTAK